MTKSEWTRRRGLGLCGWYGCPKKSNGGKALCRAHQKQQRQVRAESRKRQYHRCKEAGICTESGCGEPASDESLFCVSHRAINMAKDAKYHATDAYRLRNKVAQARRRRKRCAALGLCLRCNKPRVTKTVCEEHRQAALDDYRARSGAPKSRGRCRKCGCLGHNRRTCKGEGTWDLREPLPDAVEFTVERYASARNYVEVG